MKCTNCGHDLPEARDGITIKFCPYCGAKVIEAAAAAIAAEAAKAEEAAETVVESMEALVEETAEETVADAAETVEAVEAAAEPVVEAAQETVAEAAEAVEEAVTEAAETVEAAAEPVVEAAQETVAEVTEAVEETVAEAAEAVEAAAEPVVEAAQETVAKAAETVEAAAEAPAKPAPIGVPPEVQQPEKKKSKLPLILAIIVVVLGVAGYFVYQNLPSTKVAKFKKQAAELHTAGSYEAELEALEQALALAPDDKGIIESEAEAMLAQARALLKDDKQTDAFSWFEKTVSKASGLSEESAKKFYDGISSDIKALADADLAKNMFESAEYFLKKRNEIIPAVTGIADQTENDLLEVYTKWTEHVLATGTKEDFITQEGVIDRIKDENLLKTKTAELNALKDRLFQGEMEADLKVAGARMMSELQSNMLSVASMEVYTTFALSSGECNYIPIWERDDPDKRVPVIADIDGINKIGVYYDKDLPAVRIYIGEYDGNKRSGNGSWLLFQGNTLTNYRCYVATGTWVDDMPNGEFKIHDATTYASDRSTKTEKVTVNIKNGLFDGEAVNEYTKDSKTTVYRPSYKDGHPIVIKDHEQDGTVYHIIAYSEDKTTFLHNTNGADAIIGIPGFY